MVQRVWNILEIGLEQRRQVETCKRMVLEQGRVKNRYGILWIYDVFVIKSL